MLKFAANISMMYNEFQFMDRFAAAEKDGFKAIEFLFPYEYPAHEIANKLQEHKLKQVLFNSMPGDLALGEKGIACIPGREQEFQEGYLVALNYAQILGCQQIHLMAGFKPANVAPEYLQETFIKNLIWACEKALTCNVNVLIEPINTRDMPNYFLNYQHQAHDIIGLVGASNLKVQMDLYHCQIMEGDLAKKIQHYLPSNNVGHIQIAGVPERHEPNIGELNYSYLFNVLEQLGYQGYVGCEYRPQRGVKPNATSDGLTWM